VIKSLKSKIPHQSIHVDLHRAQRFNESVDRADTVVIIVRRLDLVAVAILNKKERLGNVENVINSLHEDLHSPTRLVKSRRLPAQQQSQDPQQSE